VGAVSESLVKEKLYRRLERLEEEASMRMAYEVKDRYRTSVTALSGLAQEEATLIFCLRPVYRWQHRLTQRNPTGTELKVRREKQCEWKRGGEIRRSKARPLIEWRDAKCSNRKEWGMASMHFPLFGCRDARTNP